MNLILEARHRPSTSATSCPNCITQPAAPDEVSAAAIRRRRDRAGVPDQVRHTEKWRLALEMIEEMTEPSGWGLLDKINTAGAARPVVVADAGYGDNTAFRLELAARGWRYVVAVKGTTQRACGRRPAGDTRPARRARSAAQARLPRAAR